MSTATSRTLRKAAQCPESNKPYKAVGDGTMQCPECSRTMRISTLNGGRMPPHNRGVAPAGETYDPLEHRTVPLTAEETKQFNEALNTACRVAAELGVRLYITANYPHPKRRPRKGA